MSRPSTYHDNQNDPFDTNGLDLPLFNHPHPPSVPHITTNFVPNDHVSASSSSSALAHFPPPSTGTANQARHSIAHPNTLASPYSAATPHSAGPYPASNRHDRQGSMSSALPYSQQRPSYAQDRNYDSMMPPTMPATTSLGSLARSASLGRRRDPYAYSSDDVESGLGSMDMGAEPTWPGYGGTRPQQNNYGPPPLIHAPSHSPRDVIMSPARGNTHSNPMNPPPVPSLVRPPPNRFDSGGSSPSRPSYSGHAQRDSFSNPYIPRGSDPGPSVPSQANQAGQWTDYRRPQTGRMPSASSYSAQSPVSEHQASSPYLRPDMIGSSPHSPMPNPYELSPNQTAINLPPSPRGWPTLDTSMPTSPDFPPRSMSNQGYPASQPATPAKGYDAPPPRLPTNTRYDPNASRSTQSSSSIGFRPVRDRSDLRPVTSRTNHGRRADPDASGQYLSVSLQTLNGLPDADAQPLKCLTTALPQTYSLCNPSFRYETTDNPRRVLTKPSKPVHNDGADNEDWDYILYVNDVLGGEGGMDRSVIRNGRCD